MNVWAVGHGTLASAVWKGCHAAGFGYNGPLDLLWFCEDVPLNGDTADYAAVLHELRIMLSDLEADVPVLISSQLPVGTIAMLEREFPASSFAYCPENLRVATADADFRHQARMIIGRRTGRYDAMWRTLCAPITSHHIQTAPETAEMSKHTMNAFLALQIAFANEIGAIARQVGANPDVVATALLTEDRVSPRAPLRPGAPFGGGHLARDCRVLENVADQRHIVCPIITHILASNRVAR